jgi:hypothetical protein
VADRWTLFGQAEVGGFGIGADSEWSVLAGATYDFSELRHELRLAAPRGGLRG